ncbi:MAG: RnfH family protein, partial [Gammaproteobacteria bacterium]
IREVIQQSGLLQQCPEIDLEHGKVGIYNELRELDDEVHTGDRVEIYRPLKADPKEARRKRARK